MIKRKEIWIKRVEFSKIFFFINFLRQQNITETNLDHNKAKWFVPCNWKNQCQGISQKIALVHVWNLTYDLKETWSYVIKKQIFLADSFSRKNIIILSRNSLTRHFDADRPDARTIRCPTNSWELGLKKFLFNLKFLLQEYYCSKIFNYEKKN